MAGANPVSVFRQSPSPGPPLRVGLLVPAGGRSSALAAAICSDLQSANYIEIAAVAEVTAPASPSDWTLAIYLRNIDARFAVADDPLAPTELAWPCATSRSAPPPALDVWISLMPADATGTLHAPLAPAPARHGVWYLTCGDSRRHAGDGNCLNEIIEGIAVTAVELRRHRGEVVEFEVLARVECATSPYPSMRVNRVAPLWNARHFVLQKLWELHSDGRGQLELIARARPAGTSHALGSLRLVSWLARQAIRRLRSRLFPSPIDTEHWKVALRCADRTLIDDPSVETLREFRWLESPKGTFWADPFLFEHEGVTWLFLEEMDYATGRAHISCGRVDASCDVRDVRTVLRLPTHLSYPQVIAAQGEVFLIPECAGSGTVTLYRARAFPDDWIADRELLEFPCVDSTVFRHGDRWWMFTSPVFVAGHASVTWIFTANDIRGPWRYCKSGPVSTSAATARGAGDLQLHGELLVRPSQDCVGGYGSALLFNEVCDLHGGRYRERPLIKLGGGWMPGLEGVHTYNRAGGWETIDGKFPAARAAVYR